MTLTGLAVASNRLNRHAGGRRRSVRRANTRAVSALSPMAMPMPWEWDQDENHHQVQGQAQLDICDCAQFGPNPPGSLGAGRASSDGQTDRQTDGQTSSFIYIRFIIIIINSYIIEYMLHSQT